MRFILFFWFFASLAPKGMCQQRDTVKVVMLVSDTSSFDYKMDDNRVSISTGETVTSFSLATYFLRGYYIRKPKPGSWHLYNVQYLDADKQPIRKNLIVWKIKVVR
jgi:hypothetical protein